MSTHSGLSRHLPMRTPREQREASRRGLEGRVVRLHRDNQLWFRCVYCRHVFDSFGQLRQHEYECPAKAVKLSEWAMQIEKFTRRQQRADPELARR